MHDRHTVSLSKNSIYTLTRLAHFHYHLCHRIMYYSSITTLASRTILYTNNTNSFVSVLIIGDFLCGNTFFMTKSLMTFITCLTWSHTATTFLPHLQGGGVHLAKFSPIFASFQQKSLENIFFVALGVHLHPLATPMVHIIT